MRTPSTWELKAEPQIWTPESRAFNSLGQKKKFGKRPFYKEDIGGGGRGGVVNVFWNQGKQGIWPF